MTGAPQAQARPRPPVFHPAPLMIAFSIAAMTWIVIGAVGYSTWAPAYHGPLAGFLSALLLIHFGALMATSIEATTGWPDSVGTYTVACLVGWGLSTSYVFLASEWTFYYQGFFWSLSGLYFGALVEFLTGVCKHVRAALAASSERARR